MNLIIEFIVEVVLEIIFYSFVKGIKKGYRFMKRLFVKE